jgi:hypothetical protein
MAEIVIVGGGIGGLAAALAVVRHGHRVVVLERAARFGEIGAGIQPAPNGIHALERLGLGDSVRARAVNVDELRFMDGTTDEHIVSMPLTESYRRRFGNPHVVVHRAELHTLLLDACRQQQVELRGGGTAVGFVHYPIACGRYLNLAASSDDGATEAFAGVPVRKARVRREFAVLGPTPRRLLELGTDWKSWVLVDRDPVDAWTATRPIRCGRFLEYNVARRGRTARIQRLARESIRLWHPAGEQALARNRALSSMSATDLHDYVAWMHDACHLENPRHGGLNRRSPAQLPRQGGDVQLDGAG